MKGRIDYLLGSPIEGEKTVSGLLISIDIEKNRCEVRPDGVNDPKVVCDYDDTLEDGLIQAIKKRIEMAGQFTSVQRPKDHFRITKIERFRVIDEDESDYIADIRTVDSRS